MNVMRIGSGVLHTWGFGYKIGVLGFGFCIAWRSFTFAPFGFQALVA